MLGKTKTKSTDVHGNVTKTTVKGNKKKEVTRVKREYASNAKPLEENPTVKRKGKKRYVKKTTYATNALPLEENPSTVKIRGNAPIKMNQQAKDDLKYMPVDDRAATMKKGPMYKYDSMAKMNSYDKDMMHERELISDAEKEIHKEDVAKKKHMHVVSRIAGRNSR